MTDTHALANQLIALCQQGENLKAIDTLYSDRIKSIEAMAQPGHPREMTGIEAVRAKNTWWIENHQVHDGHVTGPFLHGEDQFACVFRYDVTHKPSGQRMQMEEVAVYDVADGKIVRERFYYTMDPSCPSGD